MTTEERLELEFKDYLSYKKLLHFFYIHDTNGVFTYVSANITDLLGFNPEEFEKDYMTHLTANPINKNVIKQTQNALKGLQKEPYQLEIYDADFVPHTLEVNEKPIFENNKVVAVEGVAILLS